MQTLRDATQLPHGVPVPKSTFAESKTVPFSRPMYHEPSSSPIQHDGQLNLAPLGPQPLRDKLKPRDPSVPLLTHRVGV